MDDFLEEQRQIANEHLDEARLLFFSQYASAQTPTVRRNFWEEVGMEIDEDKVFAPRIGPAPDSFTLGDKDALEEWLKNQPVKEITPEQRKLLDKFDYWIEHLDLSKNRSAPRGGAVSVTSPEGTAWH